MDAGKLILRLLLYWVSDIVISAFVWIVLSAVEGMPESEKYVGINSIKPLMLLLINGFAIWLTIKDIREFLNG